MVLVSSLASAGFSCGTFLIPFSEIIKVGKDQEGHLIQLSVYPNHILSATFTCFWKTSRDGDCSLFQYLTTLPEKKLPNIQPETPLAELEDIISRSIVT